MMKNSNPRNWLLIGLIGMISFACSDDDEGGNEGPAPVSGNVIKSGQITTDETWTADKVYQLSGRVVVTDGSTLTIEAGTIIKAEAGQEANSSTLIIIRIPKQKGP
jgi:hypothetical protein